MLIQKINGIQSVYNNSNTRKIENSYLRNGQTDSVSFSSKRVEFVPKATPEQMEATATKLSKSTSGVRSVYGDEILNTNTAGILTQAVAASILENPNSKKLVVVGGDARQGSRIFVPQIAEQMKNNGFTVLHIDYPIATPLLAFATKQTGADLGFLMTASHNPWQDAGYNLVTNEAAIADSRITEPLIEKSVNIAKGLPLQTKSGNVGQIIKYDPYQVYCDYLDNKKINDVPIIDFSAIKSAGIDILYDDLGGTGFYTFPRLLQDHGIELKDMLRTYTSGPNPDIKNTKTLAESVKNLSSNMKVGLANDGDSDRFGVIDENGTFVHPNDVILLLAHHFHNNKKANGAIIRSCATSSQVDQFARNNNLPVIITPVGFKFIGEKMLELEKEGQPPLICGEESGGATRGGHIPEKDGFFVLASILELMAQEGKPVGEILKDVKKDLSVTITNRTLNYNVPDKPAFINDFRTIFSNVISGKTDKVFGMKVDAERMIREFMQVDKFKKGGDGVKICFENGSSLLVRLSGTENKARVYTEIFANTPKESKTIETAILQGVDIIARKNNATL